MHLTFYMMTYAIKYEHVSAVDGSLEVAIELHFKMHMVVRLLVQKSSKNNSIKAELEEAPYVVPEDAPKISLSAVRKFGKNVKKIMPLTLQLMVHLTLQSRVHL